MAIMVILFRKLQKLQWFFLPTLLVVAMLMSGCSEDSNDHTQLKPASGFQTSSYFHAAPELNNTKLEVNRLIYVPVYSHIYLSGLGKRELATTLSIRNTDRDTPIIIKSVDFYDTGGKLLQSYLPDAHRLSPLATAEFFIDQKDNRGGSGANFIVEWGTQQPVNEPIIEAVMVGITGTQGLSFSSSGQAIKDKGSR